MPLYFVKLLTPIYSEIEAENERAAISMLKESIRDDKYYDDEFEVEEIELTEKAVGL